MVTLLGYGRQSCRTAVISLNYGVFFHIVNISFQIKCIFPEMVRDFSGTLYITLLQMTTIITLLVLLLLLYDHLFGIVVSTSDCHPKGPGFDSRLYPRNFFGSIGSGTGSTHPREDNWVAA